jgi:hypothetical protein
MGADRYVIASNGNALRADQWVQLEQAQSGSAPLALDAATALYHLIPLHVGLPAPLRSASIGRPESLGYG